MTAVATRASGTSVLSRITGYAEAVVAGEIVTCRYVQLACQRHLDDLALGEMRGLRFDDAAADHAIRFIEQLRHSKGEWGPRGKRPGQRLVLADWQLFMVGSVFGWYRDDGTRRYRMAHTEVARKNGKTTLLAAIGNYLAFADGEAGAEVYSAATKRDQAKLCWDEARRMVESNETLRRVVLVTPSKWNLARPDTFSKFEPVGRDADTLDGLNPHGAVIDELHAHTSRDMVDVIETAVGSRRQPLIWIITTAGFDQSGIWWEKRSYAINVLEGVIDDDRLFVYLATLDTGDDWRDESVWIKANPNLGVSVYLDDLRAAVERAKANPAEQNNVRTKRLNEPTEQSVRWIDMAQWDACDDAPVVRPNARWFVGFDFAETVDLSAAVAVSIGSDGWVDCLCRFWRPEDTVLEAEKRDNVPYRLWSEQGYLTLTEGTMMSNADIADDLAGWLESLGLHVVEVPLDRFGSSGAAGRLEIGGLKPVSFPQNYEHFTAPCHHLSGLLASGRLRHGGHPVLRWMAGQMMVQLGPNDAIKPHKPKGSGLRNDGIVGLLMGLGRAMAHQQTARSGIPNIYIPGITNV